MNAATERARGVRRIVIDSIAALALLTASAGTWAGESADVPSVEAPKPQNVPPVPERFSSRADNLLEPDDTALSLTVDEHLFLNPIRDMDYNGGGEFTLSGSRVARSRVSPDRLLGLIDRGLGVDTPSAMQERRPAHALAAGLIVFTPRDLAALQPVRGDRPYASLFFLSSGRRYVFTDRPLAYDSSLTLGVLGLSAAGSVQRGLHHVTGSVRPRGWQHQISSGGELTARYSFARQALLDEHPNKHDLKWTLAGSVGTVTEASIALNLRWGRIASPWWAFTPEQNTYVQETQPAPPRLPAYSPPEFFAMAGVRFKARAYNAFLEGQFRHSDLSYSPRDLNVALGEAWVGLEFRTSSGLELRYLARWLSPEMRVGAGSRPVLWGSFELAKSFET